VGHEERGQGARNELEAEVARAIGEILGRPAESLSVDDNFFNLGGHSLLATRLVARLNKALQVCDGIDK
jgi:acyl carrier protein